MGIIKLFPARESLVSGLPAGDGKIDYLFFQCTVKKVSDFPVPSRDATNQTLPCWEQYKYKDIYKYWRDLLYCSTLQNIIISDRTL
jgi:hypothetical protein